MFLWWWSSDDGGFYPWCWQVASILGADRWLLSLVLTGVLLLLLFLIFILLGCISYVNLLFKHWVKLPLVLFVGHKNARIMYENFSKLTTKTPERPWWRHSSVFIWSQGLYVLTSSLYHASEKIFKISGSYTLLLQCYGPVKYTFTGLHSFFKCVLPWFSIVLMMICTACYLQNEK